MLANDGIEINLLFSNKTKDDILCKHYLDELSHKYKDNFKIHYTLTRHNEAKYGKWDGLIGRISWDMLQKISFPQPSDDVFIFCCGPKEMKKVVKGIL